MLTALGSTALLVPFLFIFSPAILASTVTVAPALPSTAPQFVSDELFVSAILNSTNFFRHEHGAEAATWNASTAAYAAEYLANDSDCTFAHSGGPYGENIALGCSDAASCVDAWGNERQLYRFGDPGFSETTGHFTQLVWKASTTVGCGRRLCTGGSSSKNTGWYLVCEYWPRGNIIGQFGTEVSRQISGKGSAQNRSSDNSDKPSGTEAGTEPGTTRSTGVIVGALIVFALTMSGFLQRRRKFPSGYVVSETQAK